MSIDKMINELLAIGKNLAEKKDELLSCVEETIDSSPENFRKILPYLVASKVDDKKLKDMNTASILEIFTECLEKLAFLLGVLQSIKFTPSMSEDELEQIKNQAKEHFNELKGKGSENVH